MALGLWGAPSGSSGPIRSRCSALLPMALASRLAGATLVPEDGANALARFRSNRNAGLLMFAACFVVGQTL
jgi:4-hydroxybenzoate polyprenyltransferase